MAISESVLSQRVDALEQALGLDAADSAIVREGAALVQRCLSTAPPSVRVLRAWIAKADRVAA